MRNASALEVQMRTALQQCAAELPLVLRERKMFGNKLVPRWLEPCPAFFQYIQQRMSTEETQVKVALHTSDLQSVVPEAYAGVFAVEDTRRLYSELLKDTAVAATTLSALGHAVIWAPDGQEQLSTVLHGFRKMAVSNLTGRTLYLLIPHDHFPGCDSASSILDLWRHPVLGEKWQNLVKGVEFFNPPSRQVFSGAVGPIYTTKSLAMVKLSNEGTPLPYSIVPWRPPAYRLDDGHKIRVDCMIEEELCVHHALLTGQIPGVAEWQGPFRSLASRPQRKWVSFVGTLEPQTSALVSNLTVRILRSKPQLQGSVVGTVRLFSDPFALLLEFRQGAEPALVADLIEEAIFVSPKLLAITTTASREQWADRLTTVAKNNPDRCVDRLRYRASTHGGRAYAVPELLVTGTRRGHAANPPPLLQCEISIQLGGNVRPALANDLIAQIQDTLGTTWRKIQTARSLKPGEWSPTCEVDGQWTGRLTVLPRSGDETRELLRNVHGHGVTCGGVLNIMTVTTDWRDSDVMTNPSAVPQAPSASHITQTGNGSRGRVSAAPI
jgi:hypothetical protein